MTVQTAFIWLLALPLGAAPLVYLVGRIYARQNVPRLGAGSRPNPAGWLALAGLLAAWVPLGIVGREVIAGRPVEVEIGAVLMRMDGIGLVLAAAALALGALVVAFSIPYMAGEAGKEKYFALLPALVGSVVGLGCTQDLFNLWVWFEAMAISSYMLVAFYSQQRGALEAGLKYLVQSAVGSVLVLMAISLVFSQTGSLRLSDIAAWQGPASLVLLAAGAQFLIGFGVKVAIVPLHTWLPDAHSQAPSGISAMLSGIVIEAGLVALLRSIGALPGHLPVWGWLLLGFGALNMLVGNLMALRQTQIKRLLAYSSLSHMGYMLLGFGAAVVFHTGAAAAGGFFHLITHAAMKGLAFLAAGVLLYGLHLSRGSHASLVVDDLNGAAGRYPLAAFAFSVAVLALGGLPPLAGFMSKWQIFVGGAESRSLTVIGLVVFAALNSVLSLGYYAPLVNRLYRCEPSLTVRSGKAAPALMAAPLVVMLAVVIVLGFWPALVQNVTGPAAANLVAMFGGSAIMAGY